MFSNTYEPIFVPHVHTYMYESLSKRLALTPSNFSFQNMLSRRFLSGTLKFARSKTKDGWFTFETLMFNFAGDVHDKCVWPRGGGTTNSR